MASLIGYALSVRALCLFLLVACTTPPPAPPVSREPPARRRFDTWLAAFNSGDRAKVAAYHAENPDQGEPGAQASEVDDTLEFMQMTGGFEVKKTEEATATRFVVILKERESDQFARATLEVDAAAPHRARRLEIWGIQTPAEFQPPRMTQAAAIEALRGEVDKAVSRDRFSGAVLVARDGVPIFAQAYGYADREKKVANQLDTRFRIGSMNKMFTAVATLQLVQAGKLALSDTVGKILPDYPDKALASKVTIHHLLTHTGGTGDFFGPQYEAHRLELRTLQDYVTLYGERDLAFEPGSRWEYSNYGFILLGVIIEKVSGRSYYDQVAREVFARAGMTGSSSPIESEGEPGRSIGYTRERADAAWASAAGGFPYRATSAGGGDSTVGDLLRFSVALTRHQLLDAEHTALLTTGKAEIPGGRSYAYGISIQSSEGVRCYGYGGGAPGMNGGLAICESGYTIAVLANLDPPAASRLIDFIRPRLPRR